MNTESGAVAALVLGFLLGLKHATDADHVVAVSTIVNQYKNALRGLWVGASWGLGHTAPLIVLGLIILVFKGAVIDFYDSIAPIFEFGVGIMLVFLGLQVYWNLRKGRLHVHQHAHDGNAHMHIHGTHQAVEDPAENSHNSFSPGKPFFRMKSFVIGMVHGLAGSAAVMLALLPTIDSFIVGVLYLLLFGFGTVMSMAVITIILSLPFAMSGSRKTINNTVSSIAGAASVILGLALMVEISTDSTILPF